MRNPTIWESANRPLFVRSVWVESEGHRHFILDYETKRRNSEQFAKPKKRIFKQSGSYEHTENPESATLKLVGSPKKPCHPLTSSKQMKPQKFRLMDSSSSQNVFIDLLKSPPPTGIQEGVGLGSKRSSLQNINSEAPTSDEKLAERVMNWLDLAGKTPLIRPNIATDVVTSKQEPVPMKKEQFILTRTPISQRRPDSVKHITIIFNKEGVPIRYNRPLRYSDLFRSGYTASKKFANTITSRYAKGTNNISESVPLSKSTGNLTLNKTAINMKSQPKTKEACPSGDGGSGGGTKKTFDNDYRPMINKQILQESCNLYEVKKQLHIFMPSLPKKTPVVTPTDCASSILSAVLSDQCKL